MGNPVRYTDPRGNICLDPWAPSGIHFDPNRDCEYPEGSTGAYWWRRDPIGENTAIISMPWVDEMDAEFWKKYPNSCGAAALYMFLKGEGKPVVFETLVQQLQPERPGGYDPYCGVYSDNGSWGAIPSPTPDPNGWNNKACVSADALASVARKYYGLNIEAGDNWTYKKANQKVKAGHPMLTLIRVDLTTTDFGHFVVIRGFDDAGWTVILNDSCPARRYGNRSASARRNAGERRREDWEKFDLSWASAVDAGNDPLAPGGHVRWGMAVK